MQLWTVQTERALRTLERDGQLCSDRNLVDSEFLPAYDWMTDQMGQRIALPPTGISVPLWAWYQYESASRQRPDLRRSNHLPRGETGFLIEFNANDGSVLLSDFDLWHFVLNYWYLPGTVADGERVDSKHGFNYGWNKLSPTKLDRRIRDSRRRIFDLDWYDPELTVEPGQRRIQGTFWTLKADSVRTVKKFVAR